MNWEPDFDIDRSYGEEGENLVRAVLGLASDRIEVKRKRFIDDEFYVETAQAPRRGYIKPSGIQTTKATYWAYVIGDTGVIVLVPTERLRRTVNGAAG